MSVIPDRMPALAGQLARALPTVDPVSNMSAHPAPFWLIRRSGPSFALMLVTAARESFAVGAMGSADATGLVAATGATGAAESPARLSNLSAISAVRGLLARPGQFFALMLVTRAARSRSLEGIAGMSA